MHTATHETEQILAIARSIAGETGHAMLASLVDALNNHLNTAFVAVTYGEGAPPTHARAIYAMKGGAVAEHVRYALEGTPCARVFEGETLTVPCDIAALYPREAGFEGYIGIPLRNEAGRVAGHLAIFSDTPIARSEVATAIATIFAQRAEAELRRLQVEAERQRLIADLTTLNRRLQGGYAAMRRENAQKTALMGLIAHDLRRPLSAAVSQAELSLSRLRAPKPDAAKVEQALTKVLANADRMAQLIDATLERVRDAGAALKTDPHPCDLAGLVRVALEANAEEAARKRITLDFAPPAPVIAEVDDVLIVSAIDNLLSNAVKYTHPGGCVTVALAREGASARLSVTDTGQGLTAEDLARVFGRFQTLSARPTDGERSIGLGLANVRDIALAHGGEAHAESAGRGKGSRFSLLLPRASSPA
ncbi:MAG: HAMP domain-containing sensor histidine kinase [Roseovarius sp.]